MFTEWLPLVLNSLAKVSPVMKVTHVFVKN